MTASSLEKKIIRQIEYYFGDFNLPKDKFLLEEIKKDDGWVSLDTMTNFKRLAALSSDHEVLVEALKKSPTSLMEINEDGKKIRRDPNAAVPSNMKEVYDKYEDRTVFVKGFKPESTLDDVESFFDKAGTILNIVMRRCANRKSFKGSVFVTFQKKEECDNFLSSEDFQNFEDTPMIRMLRTEYVDKKSEEKQKLKANRAEAQADAEKKRTEMRKARLLSRMTLGALLELSGVLKDVKESEVITCIKSMMRSAETPDVAFVETNELTEGRVVVRFKDENSAAQAMSKLQSKEGALTFRIESAAPVKESDKAKEADAADNAEADNDKEKSNTEESESENNKPSARESCLVCRVVSGEEEQKLWERILEQRDKRQMQRKGKHGFGGHRDGEPHRKRQRVSNR